MTGTIVKQNGKVGNMDLRQIFKNKRIFLTGHTGFKGSWLLNWLHLLGGEVKGYALAPEDGNSLYNLISGDKLCESVIADVCDAEKLKKEILLFQPDFIFHLAAQPLVRLSYEIPVHTFSVNAIGTANLLDTLRELKKACTVVMITTDKVYNNLEKDHYYSESDALGGYDPYSASKACAELIIESYRKSFFNPGKYSDHLKSVSTARAGNVIGGGDWAKDRLIPDIIRALQIGEEVIIRNPNSIRPWQHVLEPLYGYLLLAAHQQQDPVNFSRSYNFGPVKDDQLNVEGLVKVAVKSWGNGSFKYADTKNELHEAGLLQLDINRAINELGWKPKMDSYNAIDTTIQWYKNILVNNHDAAALITKDIIEYESI